MVRTVQLLDQRLALNEEQVSTVEIRPFDSLEIRSPMGFRVSFELLGEGNESRIAGSLRLELCGLDCYGTVEISTSTNKLH